MRSRSESGTASLTANFPQFGNAYAYFRPHQSFQQGPVCSRKHGQIAYLSLIVGDVLANLQYHFFSLNMEQELPPS